MKRLAMTLAGMTILSGAAYAEMPRNVITGGIGEESERAIERVQNNYNTKLVFTGKDGAYLADVSVNIRDTSGEPVLSGVSEGPLMLAELTKGSYIVEARKDGHKEIQKISVGEDLKTYQIRFPLDYDMQFSAVDHRY